MADHQGFRVLGFPVTIAPGFVLGLLLLLALNSRNTEFGIRLVIALAAFTLIHELGHAIAARHYGADAAITLNFLVGWTGFRPRRPLTRPERAVIGVAGPLIQIVIGVALLLLLGADPLSYADVRTEPLTLALWWAGPVLGLANLLPLHPLDGGNVVGLGLDRIVPGKGHDIVQYWTLAACAVAVVGVLVSPTWRPWAITVALFTFWNLQSLAYGRRRRGSEADVRRTVAAATDAERAAWASGRPGLFPPGIAPSPWYRSKVLLDAGKTDTARRLLIDAVERGGGVWLPPPAEASEQLRPLVELLPDPLPVGDLQAGWVLQRILHDTGYLRRSAEYGNRLYAAYASPAVALQVARSLALLGHADDAVGWLRVAGAGLDDVSVIDGQADFDSLRSRPDFQAVRTAVASRAAA